MFKRLLSLFTLLMLVMMGALTAVAQDDTMDETMPETTIEDRYCGDLSESDCTLLRTGVASMEGMNAAGFVIDFNLLITDPGATPESVTFSGGLEGAFDIDRDQLPAMSNVPQDMQALTGENLRQIFDDLAQGADALDAEVTITFDIPTELDPSGSLPPSIIIESKLVDGTGYLNMDTFGELVGPMADFPTGWHGANVPQLMTGFLQAFGGLFNDLEGMMQGAAGAEDPFSMGLNAGTGFADMDMETVGQFLSVERLDDRDIMGQESITFQTTMDLGAFYEMPEARDILRAQFAAQGIPESEIDMLIDQTVAMLEDTEFYWIESYSVESGFMTYGEMHFMFDTANMPDMQDDLAFTMDASLNYFNINGDQGITAPANATLHTFEELFGALMGGMGQMN